MSYLMLNRKLFFQNWLSYVLYEHIETMYGNEHFVVLNVLNAVTTSNAIQQTQQYLSKKEYMGVYESDFF